MSSPINYLTIRILICLQIFLFSSFLLAQQHELQITAFQNRYRVSGYSGPESAESKPGAGFALSYIYSHKPDSNYHPLFSIGFMQYSGNINYSYSHNYAFNYTKFTWNKSVLTAGIYPVNLRLFHKNMHLFTGLEGYCYLLRKSTGSETQSRVVGDTTIGTTTYPIIAAVKENYNHQPTKYDRKFAVAFSTNCIFNILKRDNGILKSGLFFNLFLSPEFSGYTDLRPMQYGVNVSWVFK